MNKFKTSNLLFITVSDKSNQSVEKVEMEKIDVLEVFPSNDKEDLSTLEQLTIQLIINSGQLDHYLAKTTEIIKSYNHLSKE